MDTNTISTLCELLKQAEKILLRLEQETARLAVCHAEDVDACAESRLDLITQVDSVMNEVELLCAGDTSGMLHLAAAPDTDFGMLPAWAEPIYDARQCINAVVCRILTLERQAAGRLTLERDRLLAQIRENNQGQSANAARFLGAMQGTDDQVFFPTKPRTI